jgi:membrane protein YqaA with SNARE-associated domain
MEFSDAGLAGLFLSAFVSATVLPGNSEIVLFAFLKAFPDRVAAAIAVATVGNTLGGLTTYGLGRLLPEGGVPSERALAWVRRYGALALLLSWVPLVGDRDGRGQARPLRGSRMGARVRLSLPYATVASPRDRTVL